MTSDPEADAGTAPKDPDGTPAAPPAGQPPAAALVRHEAAAMTVGQLRAALAELPDSTPIKVAVPDGRGCPATLSASTTDTRSSASGSAAPNGATGGWRPNPP
ncbi:DUF6225 family protein [Yinghuangia aomiensis]